MTFDTAADRLASLLGARDIIALEDHKRQDIIGALEAGLEELAARAPQWGTQKEFTAVTVASTDYITVDSTVQSVVGPVLVTYQSTIFEIPLIRGRARWQAAKRGDFLGASAGGPFDFCFLEPNQQTTADSLRKRIYLYPTPTAVYTITYLGTVQPPVEVAIMSATAIPIPQAYHHSIFLPIVRFHLLSSSYLSPAANRNAIEGAYEMALDLLDRVAIDHHGQPNHARTPRGW